MRVVQTVGRFTSGLKLFQLLHLPRSSLVNAVDADSVRRGSDVKAPFHVARPLRGWVFKELSQ